MSAQQMTKQEELEYMRNSLRNSVLAQGIAWTPERQRMLDRELTIVRIVGGYAPNSPNSHPIQQIDSKTQMLPANLSARSVNYSTRSIAATQTYAIDVKGTGCKILPEAIGNDSYIHVQSEHGMNIGIVIARAQSPKLNEPNHITRTIEIVYDSKVNGQDLVYGPGARCLLATGENTFVDVLPGRFHIGVQQKQGLWGLAEEDYIIDSITPIVSDKSKPYTGKPDMELKFVGAVLPTDEEPYSLEQRTKMLQQATSRAISFGKEIQTYIKMDAKSFEPSSNPLDHYLLRFMFD